MFESKQYNEADIQKETSSDFATDTSRTASPEVDFSGQPAVAQETVTPKSTEILKGIIEAAEHNEAIEKVFEMRHEAKDEETTSANKNDMPSIGEILENRENNYKAVAGGASSAGARQTSWLHKVVHDNSLYSHAIRYGFATAILALLSAVLLVTLFT